MINGWNLFGFLAKNKPVQRFRKTNNIPGANWLILLLIQLQNYTWFFEADRPTADCSIVELILFPVKEKQHILWEFLREVSGNYRRWSYLTFNSQAIAREEMFTKTVHFPLFWEPDIQNL